MQLEEALENESMALILHEANDGELTAAKTAREVLVTSAAAGAPIKPTDLTRATGLVKEAEAACEISAAIHGAAIALRHQAEVERWREEAAGTSTEIAAARENRIVAAREVDEAAAAVRKSLEKFHAAGVNLMLVRGRATHWNSQHSARTANPVYAELGGDAAHVNDHDKAEIRSLRFLITAASGWFDCPPLINDLAASEARLHPALDQPA